MGTGQIQASGQGSVEASREFTAAHQALTSDSSVQFSLTPAPPPPEPPKWLINFLEWLGDVLKPVGKAIDWVGQFMPHAPLARYFLWTVLAIVVATLLYLIFERLRHGEWRIPWRRRHAVEYLPVEEEEWRPEAGPARSWLEEADALAAKGRFAEAIHHLLLRSIDDISNRRPQLVRPALTSRELAASDGIPIAARDLFAKIAALVERTLFGGREVGRPDWEGARSAYADFALPRAWAQHR